MSELYDNARKAFETKQAKMNNTNQPKVEDSEESRNERRQRFKTVQAEFVKHITQVGTELAQKCFNDPEYTKSFIDVFKFNPPPKRNESQNVYFQDVLLIELMEGPQTSGYEAFFNDVGTDTTLSMLQEALKPFRLYYGYFPRFGGNIIQLRLDDTIPKWALVHPQQFERKKAMSRKNRDRSSPQVGNDRRRPFRQNHPSNVVDLFRLLSQGYNQRGRGGYANSNFNRENVNRATNFNRSTSPNQQSFKGASTNNNGYRRGNRNFRTNDRGSFNKYPELKNDYSRSGNKHVHTADDYVDVEA